MSLLLNLRRHLSSNFGKHKRSTGTRSFRRKLSARHFGTRLVKLINCINQSPSCSTRPWTQKFDCRSARAFGHSRHGPLPGADDPHTRQQQVSLRFIERLGAPTTVGRRTLFRHCCEWWESCSVHWRWRASPTRLSKSITSRSVKEGNSNTCSEFPRAHCFYAATQRAPLGPSIRFLRMQGTPSTACLQVGCFQTWIRDAVAVQV